MTVVVVKNSISKTIKVGFAVGVGGADSISYEVYGVPHFLEHLLFTGSKNYPGDAFRRLVTENGGSTNAYTTHDNTVYYTKIGADKLELMFKLYSDILKNLEITDEKVKAEIGVVLSERQMRYEANPFGRIMEAHRRSLYHQHPYGFPNIGYPHHIQNYSREAAQAQFDKYYRCPENITLIISGNCDPEQVYQMAKKYFGDIPAKDLPKRQRPQELDRKGIVTHLKQESDRIAMVSYWLSYHAPNHRGPNAKHFFPLLLLEQIMAGNETMRMYNKLVRKDKLATEASTFYNSNSYDENTEFTFNVTLAPGKDLKKLKKALAEMIVKISTELVTEEELDQAKQDILASLAFAKDGNDSAFSYFTLLSIGFTVDDIENHPESINKVTREDVLAAAKFVFADKGPVATMTVYPKPKADKAATTKTLDTATKKTKSKKQEHNAKINKSKK